MEVEHWFFKAWVQNGLLVPLTGHWPEVVTWPQPNSRGGWEMWGAHGFLLSIKYQCHTSKDTDKETIISTQCVGGSDPGMHRAPRKHR